MNQVAYKFSEDYVKAAIALSLTILAGRYISKSIIEKKIIKTLTPIIEDMFDEGIVASNKLVKKDIAKLVTKYNIPYKYNKKLLEELNDKSIFNGYYDKKYKDIFTKTEINRIKNVILQSKYGEWDEKKTINTIKKTVKITTNKARLLARNEKARLTTAAKTLYFKKKEVRDEYDLIWRNSGNNIRPDHMAMNGKKADKDGYFYSSSCGRIPGPPFQCSPYNCKCYVELAKK